MKFSKLIREGQTYFENLVTMKKPSRRDACPLTSDGKAKVPERNADIVAYARGWIVNRMA